MTEFALLHQKGIDYNLERVKARDAVAEWERLMEHNYGMQWYTLDMYLNDNDELEIKFRSIFDYNIIEDTINRFDLIVVEKHEVIQEYYGDSFLTYIFVLRHRKYASERGLIDWRR